MPSYLDKIIKQSPWLIDYQRIEDDPQLVRLQRYPLIYHEDVFLNHQYKDGVYIVTGPRQVGKSRYLKMLIQN